jgi:hypothetical protein
MNCSVQFDSNANSSVAAPSLNLTPDEKRVFGHLFRQADTENIGVVTGEVAVKFFEKTRLEPRILGEVSLTPHTLCHIILENETKLLF